MNEYLRLELYRAAKDLDLDIVSPFEIQLMNGERMIAEALFTELGAPMGTVVVETSSSVSMYGRELKKMNYTLSSFMGPTDNQLYDLDSYKDMFREWGWCAIHRKPPKWYNLL